MECEGDAVISMRASPDAAYNRGIVPEQPDARPPITLFVVTPCDPDPVPEQTAPERRPPPLGAGLFGRRSTRITIDLIQRTSAVHFDIPLIEMVSDRRSRGVARPRQVAMYLATRLTTKSLVAIGERFGNRNHTTVIHARDQIERLRDEDPRFDHVVGELERRLAPNG